MSATLNSSAQELWQSTWQSTCLYQPLQNAGYNDTYPIVTGSGQELYPSTSPATTSYQLTAPVPTFKPLADADSKSESQRRILPLSTAIPTAPAAGSAQIKKEITQKNADGKFPCPDCTKSYMHAKHLKRHILTHTGKKSYMCVLYKSPFARSDVLKRHFKKCASTRGNPTGATHLSNLEAYLDLELRDRRSWERAAAWQRPMETEGDVGYGSEVATTMQIDLQLPDYSTSQN
ncbi:hypothetical protein C7999DRAFT_18373 [Corynascus novoguineensis]|uniref:C2H2-type domain-containing protein n=1 Tax=Corynascus novoguineensis TaxID=1126955 RepID=A0AAN7HIK2_9PEZI|nr:hypothetical protein C7999DRAFT_18373 [Corynascus novoguineensis]